jgi:hypothetical protein
MHGPGPLGGAGATDADNMASGHESGFVLIVGASQAFHRHHPNQRSVY